MSCVFPLKLDCCSHANEHNTQSQRETLSHNYPWHGVSFCWWLWSFRVLSFLLSMVFMTDLTLCRFGACPRFFLGSRDSHSNQFRGLRRVPLQREQRRWGRHEHCFRTCSCYRSDKLDTRHCFGVAVPQSFLRCCVGRGFVANFGPRQACQRRSVGLLSGILWVITSWNKASSSHGNTKKRHVAWRGLQKSSLIPAMFRQEYQGIL